MALRILTFFLVLNLIACMPSASAAQKTLFKRVPTQFIAALGDPDAKSGTGAQTWGLWTQDPGPRGVWLSLYNVLNATGGYAPALWKFDSSDWWLDENGLIMEKPQFPVPPGKYLVTGERETISMLTIHPEDENGESRWELDQDAKLYDVTHLPCRSSRFTPASSEAKCTPANAPRPAFPLAVGTKIPEVAGCKKQDYSVLFIIGVPVEGQKLEY